MIKWVITSEHGGNEVPQEYKWVFEGHEAVLESHRGYDPGTREIYEALPEGLADFSAFNDISRLLVELNRSLHHPMIFSEYSRQLPAETRAFLIAHYYRSYRERVERQIAGYRALGHPVLHIGLHSFTPVLNGQVRHTDIGLLYDPQFAWEKALARQWKAIFKNIDPRLRVRFNYPYQGKNDGFTTTLRRQYPEGYAGIELEVNQKYAGDPAIIAIVIQSMLKLKEEGV